MPNIVQGLFFLYPGVPFGDVLQFTDTTGGTPDAPNGGTNINEAVGAFTGTAGLPTTINTLAEWQIFADALQAKTTEVTPTGIEVYMYANEFVGVGGDGNDVFQIGNVAPATIHGGAGNDTITTSIFNQVSGGTDFGGFTNDLIFGGAGDDIINGGGGVDTLIGGLGADTFVISKNSHLSDKTIDGTAEQGTIDTVRLDAAFTYDFSSAAISDIDQILLNDNAFGFGLTVTNFEVSTADANGDGTFGDLQIASAIPMTNGVTIDASGLTGSNHIVVEGNAEATNFGGADHITGGAGDDIIASGEGADTINGGAGDDIIAAGGGDDNVAGGAGNDLLDGHPGNDTLDGGDGNDLLAGREGNDLLVGGAGNDLLNGGLGADRLAGGDGTDTAIYSSAIAGVTANLGNSNANTGEAAGDSYNSIENLTGSNFNDKLIGDAGNNVLEGRAGADLLDGGKGINTASYENALAGLTADLNNSANNTGEASGDTYKNIQNLLGSNHSDQLVGDNADNVLNGGDGADTLVGNKGGDTLIGGFGNDFLTGGKGNDTFVFAPGLGNDTVTDLDKHDTLDLSGLGFNSLQEVWDNTMDVGSNAVITSGADTITLEGVTLAQLQSHSFDVLV
jgi:Ca2+-binding RTX toxin-like protein